MSARPDDTAARGRYHDRLKKSLRAVCGLESIVLASGAFAHWACMGPGSIIPHAPLQYPFARMKPSVEGVWRANATRVMLIAGYEENLSLLDMCAAIGYRS